MSITNNIQQREYDKFTGDSKETTAVRITESSEEYITLIDEASATITYVGKALPGSATNTAVWQIKRISISGTVTSVLWADDNNDFDNVWDDRTTITYG
jgi:hypothetical protein